MKNLETESAVAEAVSFLSSRITEQSRVDSVPLTEIELRQLAFSEETASPDILAEASKFDATNDRTTFEKKITKLLRRAYREDVQQGMGAIWREHLAALRDHDIYVLVMVDLAKIARPKPSLLATYFAGFTHGGLVRMLPGLALGIVALSGFVYFCILPMNTDKTSGVRMFESLAEKLIPNEGVRLLGYVVWIACVYLAGRFFPEKQIPLEFLLPLRPPSTSHPLPGLPFRSKLLIRAVVA
jgi:hypothetical protein